MKSPIEVAEKLARQWDLSSVRLERLLKPESWPLLLPIGKPSASAFTQNPRRVQEHIERWRGVSIGTVDWELTTYRSGLEPVWVPVRWRLAGPSQWVAAASNPEVSRQYQRLEHLVEHVDEIFHALLIAQRPLWLKKAPEEVIAAAALATRLAPGCAQGRPLRLLAEHGVDTKFFERNSPLLTRLLDLRFEGEVAAQGLTNFLDAFEENNHWVLVAPLSPSILPFKRLRITTLELAQTELPCSRVLVVENEQCIHLLPALADTIAVLGSGLDLQWLASPSLAHKTLGYWGDMDTWGLLMLARAKRHQSGIVPLLMNRPCFERYAAASAVSEPVQAQQTVPDGLGSDEAELYRYLLTCERNRLEQEYLPQDEVHKVMTDWALH